MKKIFLIPLALFLSCNSIDQNQADFNVWVQTASKPIVVKWQNKTRGILDYDDALLIDAKHNVLYLQGCEMTLPDTLK